ncbi:killer cell lectin-like receptor subfamily B member 1B allele B isoform X2 [Nycticebus coucang]|uniref:killer cell lectin-like receptor subfamily B member 1B allele B isoform X2 n=1 Tax=Nycticebus coucang TaxID=9470 RepID=UPI00234D8AC1|nr:killer cell lectin-like receptor subfamily B member 1B allele B isoform X2 [Nycticebus coucang]
MAGDIVYADIKTVRTSPLECLSQPQKSVVQFHSARHSKVDNDEKAKPCAGGNKSGIITTKVPSNSSTVHKSCPTKDWKLLGGKCYWVPETKKTWNGSQGECTKKNSHLIVIQDFIDMSFLWLYQNFSASYWIGLKTTLPEVESWTWVDNSSFNLNHLFLINTNKQRTRSMKCATVSGRSIVLQNCQNHNQWICELSGSSFL